MTSLKNVRGYIRVSTTDQANTGMSLETQEKRIQSYCLFKSLNLIKMYRDEGKSGKNMDRPGLQQLINEVQSGDSIIITDLSRLSRNTRETLQLFHDFKEKGVYFICIELDVDFNTPIGAMLMTVLMSVHQLERENTSANVSANMQRLSREGKLRSRAPLGFRFVGKDRDLEPVPEQQRVIERIKTMYSSGMKYLQIAKQLNEEGENRVLNLNKKDQNKIYVFHAETIRRILMDAGLVPPVSNRKPISERIITHHSAPKQ